MRSIRPSGLAGLVLIVLSLLSLNLVVVAPCTAQEEQKIIKYGTMHPLTGPYSFLGRDQQRATELAVNEWNAKGGVLGHKIVWVSRDDQLNGAVALRKAKELVEEEKCDFIGGTLSGAISLGLNDFACKNNVLYLAFCQTDMMMGNSPCKYGSSCQVIPYSAALAVSKYAFQNLGKRWFAITANYEWGQSLLKGWMWQNQLMGGEFLGNVYVPLGTTDFSPYFAKIEAANPDFIVMNNIAADQTAAIKQASELGLTKKMKIVCTKTAMHTIKELGPVYDENVIGGMTFFWKLQDKYRTSKRFNDNYMQKYGDPVEQDGESGYVAANVLFMAMEKAGSVTDKDKIMQAMEGLKYELTKGPEYVRGCDHQRVQSYLLVRGKGEKGTGWDIADIIAEIPGEEIIMSCEDNARKLPFVNIKLPR